MLNGEWQNKGFLSGEIQKTIVDTSGEPQEKVVKPSTSEIIVEPDANKTLVKVVVEGVTADVDSNIVARNIRGGVEILGIVGDLEPDKPDQTKSIVPAKEQQRVVADSGYELASVTVEAIPSEYIKPSGTIEITKNGIHNIKDYENANIDVPVPDLSQTTATESDVAKGKVFYNASGEKATGTYTDRLQWICNNVKKLRYTFDSYRGDGLNEMLQGLDVSNVELFEYTFRLSNISDISKLDFKNAKGFSNTFQECGSLREVSIDLSNATSCYYMFYRCVNLTKASLVSTSKVGIMQSFFDGCSNLEELTGLDLLSCTSFPYLVYNCKNLKKLEVKNIKSTFQIGSGTSWGHLLTLESLLNAIKELWTNTGTSTLKLIMGTANISKLENVYVKLIPITDEMRAEDEYIDNKAPFEVGESTDEGAMLITEYVTTVKNWQLA